MATFPLTAPPQDYDGDGPKEFEVVPDGEILDAVCSKVEARTKPFKRDDGSDINVVEYTFETTYNGQERKFWGETPQDFYDHPDCRFRNWVQELLATELPPGFVVNTDHLVGQSCRITIGIRIPKQGKNAGKQLNYVQDVLRPRSAMSGFTPPPSDPANEPF